MGFGKIDDKGSRAFYQCHRWIVIEVDVKLYVNGPQSTIMTVPAVLKFSSL